MGEAEFFREEHDRARRVAGAMQDVESDIADLTLLSLVEQAVGSEIAHAGDAEALSGGDDVVEQIFVGDMRAFDLDAERVAQFSGAADMIDMAMRDPDLLDRHAGLLDRLLN